MAYSAQQMGSPVFILGSDSQRTRGRDAQSSNIAAGKAVAEAVRTTLGPRGMDKMLVDTSGNVVVTNDGVTILEEMDIEHPAAQMVVEVAHAQESEVGDGTTTAAVLAGQLLGHAESLLEDDVHPTAIVEGYAAARDLALDAIEDATLDGDVNDDTLRQVAASSMTGKGTGDVAPDVLADLVVQAVRSVETSDGVDPDSVRVHAQTGEASSATSLVHGVVVDDGPVRDDMARSLEDAAVAVVEAKLAARETNADVEYNVTSVDQLNAAVDAEIEELRGLADAIADTGVDVVFATKDVDDRVAGYLAKRGVTVFDSVSTSNARAVADATGARLVGDARDLEDADLGTAASVRVDRFDGDDATVVEGGRDTETVTLFVRGSTEHVVEELERALGDAIDVVAAALGEGGVVPGAGHTELAIAARVRDGAASIDGRAQLAAEAFADAVDAIPRTLAVNAGVDPVDALADLRAANETGRAGLVSAGGDATIADPIDAGVLDPAAVKREAVEAATEAATLVVRIDDIIAAE